jgi:hypothetical protein
LNKFFSSFTIDPLQIARQKPKDQIETIKEIAGIDTSKIEAEALEIYNKRTDENRELTRLKGVVSEYAGVEKVEEVSVTELIAERDRKQHENAEIERYENKKGMINGGIKDAEDQLEEAKQLIATLEQDIKDYNDQIKECDEYLEKHKEHDLEEITANINKSEETNENARKYKEKEENIGKLQKQQEVHDALDTKYKETLAKREKLIADSDIPNYISFDKNAGVLVNNIPFTQLNTAEQIKISIQLGSILTPELKVLHIKDGSLLDQKTMEEVQKIVKEHDYQILIERVGESDQGTITMREGVKIK